jgi:hypothetical protein
MGQERDSICVILDPLYQWLLFDRLRPAFGMLPWAPALSALDYVPLDSLDLSEGLSDPDAIFLIVYWKRNDRTRLKTSWGEVSWIQR